MDFLTIVFIFIIIALILVQYFRWRVHAMSAFERNGIKGPKPHLIYGNMKELQREGNVKCVEKWMKQYGPIFGYYVGRAMYLVIADPHILKQIEIKDFSLFSDRYKPLKHGFSGDSRADAMLINANGHRWKELRTILKQAFTAAKMKSSVAIMDDTVNTLMGKIAHESENGNEFDIYEMYQGLTMETIGRSAFGVMTNAQNDFKDPFLLAAKEVFETNSTDFLIGLSLCFIEFEPILLLLRKLKNLLFTSASEYLMKISSLIVEQRRKVNEKRNDLLQAMLDAKVNLSELQAIDEKKLAINSDMNAAEKSNETVAAATVETKKSYKYMTDNEIVANVVLFFEAGYETTSTALAFVTHVLVNHPDIQEKLREEVKMLYAKEGKLDYNAVSQLPLMEAVINETLRMYPPITFFVSRVAKSDYKIEGLTIPKGTGIMVPVYQLHHDPRFWIEPEKFDYTRFYGENKSNANSIVFQPFGAGPRNCIGMRFAWFEMKLALSKILLKYRLEFGSKTEHDSIAVRYKTIVMCPNHVFVKAVPT